MIVRMNTRGCSSSELLQWLCAVWAGLAVLVAVIGDCSFCASIVTRGSEKAGNENN
jgi:hypothetical protein